MSTSTTGTAVEIERRRTQPVLSIRATALVAALGEAQGERLTALSRYMSERGITPGGPPVVRYHTFGDTETDVETGIPVVDAAVGAGRIQAGELPGGEAITTWHTGPDEQLGEAYARIGAWLQENHREPDGPAWEVYTWIHPGVEPDPSAPAAPEPRRIQLVQPIK